jgi:hypothetical protein
LEKDLLHPFADDEMQRIGQFLLQRHVPLATGHEETYITAQVVGAIASPRAASATLKAAPRSSNTADDRRIQEPARCKHCSQTDLTILHGKFGYYFKCRACQKNTATDPTCTACGTKAKVRKSGPAFYRACEKCGSDLLFHTNAEV